MSTEEQQRVTGQAVEEYGKVRKELAANLTKADQLGKVLLSIGCCLSGQGGSQSLPAGDRPSELDAMPPKSEVRDLVEDVLKLQLRKLELREKLKPLGVDLAD